MERKEDNQNHITCQRLHILLKLKAKIYGYSQKDTIQAAHSKIMAWLLPSLMQRWLMQKKLYVPQQETHQRLQECMLQMKILNVMCIFHLDKLHLASLVKHISLERK